MSVSPPRSWLSFLICALALAEACPSLAQDAAKPAQELQRKAEAGDKEAQFRLGAAYEAQKNYQEARTWYERAAAQGHAQATNNLAYLYDLGVGTKQDRQRGFDLYRRAADLGSAEAMWNLANMYGAGQLGEKDFYMACVWTFRALRFAEPGSKDLFVPASRAAAQLEKSMIAEKLWACKQQAESWRPLATSKP